ncbi:hypothetical protein HELRODRAFT_158600 [Helobdella robusta]|uniref:Uncharacterized protein n=1 Tax=Helobdella robusta TaxID=6412 RepID=T1EN02_HELRO|nr:hypothetical protein HELRODRAFT_158600 [Helobdella robusta]ESO12149.1 hypothetical protein HELRODRAFT_158600 [Helobdella robusta]
MRSGSILKAAAITKYTNTLIINFNSKTFTNSKRGSKAMWDQVNKIRGSDKSFNTSTSQQIVENTINTYFASMSTDPFYKIPPTKATTINSRHQHQQFTSFFVLHMLTQTTFKYFTHSKHFAHMVSKASNYSTSLNASNKQLPPGLATQQQFQQLQSLIKKLIRFNYLPASYPTVIQIFNTLDSRVFKKV